MSLNLSPSVGKRKRFLYGIGVSAIALLITAGVFASNDWFPKTDPLSGKRFGWFGKPLAKNAPSAWNPLAMPSPTPTPQLSKELIYAGSRLLTVEDKNATALPPADLAIWRPGNWTWYVRNPANGAAWVTQAWGDDGPPPDQPVPGDYDGDGTTDFAVWRPTNYTWYVIYSSNNSTPNYAFGASGDLTAQADYDGDGRTDEAIYRPSNGTWYIHASTSGYYTDYSVSYAAGDKPAPADYDGDGKADICVFRPSDRTFRPKLSSDNSTPTISPNFNPSTPIWTQVSADYDGDGKADYAVFDEYGGKWYIRNSSTASWATPQTWGQAGDIPVPNDYDETPDGKVDVTIWRPSNGTWYIIESGNGYTQRNVTWGQAGDVPVPAFYRR